VNSKLNLGVSDVFRGNLPMFEAENQENTADIKKTS
jgi:hypothetical protein